MRSLMRVHTEKSSFTFCRINSEAPFQGPFFVLFRDHSGRLQRFAENAQNIPGPPILNLLQCNHELNKLRLGLKQQNLDNKKQIYQLFAANISKQNSNPARFATDI